MIVQTREDKNLIIPKSLGNFVINEGGTGGVTPEEAAEIASAVTEAAIDEYDTDLQENLDGIRTAVSGNTDAIEELSASTSGMSADIAAVSGQTSANTENIASLSAATEAISESLANYATTADTNELATAISGVSESLANYATTATTDALSAVTSALTEDIEALSAVTSGVSEDIAALSASTQSIAGSIPTANSAWINISDSAGTVANFNIQTVESTIATFNDKDVYKFAFSMYLCYLKSDADRYRGNLVAFEKSYNGVSRNFYFQFIIVIDEVPYNAEYYYNYNDGTMNKIAFEPYADYVSRMVSGGTDSNDVVYDYDAVTAMTNSERLSLVSDMMTASSQGKRVYLKQNIRDGYWWYEMKYGNRASDYNANVYFYPATLNYTLGESQLNINKGFKISKTTGAFSEVVLNLPPASTTIRGGILVSSGLTADTTGHLSVDIGDGLAFSGNTIVVSGASGGGKETIIINDLDSTGLAALATRLFGYYDSEDGTIDFPVDELELYWWVPDPNYAGGYDDNGYKDYVKVMPVNVQETEWEQNGMWLSGPFSLGSFDGGNLLRNFRILILEDGSLVGAGVDAVPVPQEISYSWVRFGNDERGELTYDADNDCFYYDSNTIATGDTTNVYEDLIDYLMTDSMFEGGLIFGSIYPVNYFRLYVTENGETKVYTHPVLSKKTFENPVTIDSQDFYKEVTYNYGDWKFTAYYGANDGNNAANLRMARV